MRKSKSLLTGAMLMSFALLAAACGGGGGGGGGEAAGGKQCTWVLGTMGALSGDYAAIGVPIVQGIEYAVEQINAKGDLACELQLEKEDSQGSPDQAPQLAQKLAQNQELVAVVGPYFSGETLASGDIFNDAGLAFICPSCTNETIDDQGWDTFFRAVGDDAVQGEQAANYISKGLQAKTVAIIHDNQDYSKGLAERVKQGLGAAAKGPFIISPEETDYSATVSQVRNVNPDVVFYGGYVPQAGPLAKQLKEGGVDAQFLSDDGSKDDQFGKLAGAASAGAQVTCPCADPSKVPAGKEFVSGMQQKFGEPPGTFGAEAYDATNLVAEALKNAKADDSVDQIRQSVVQYLDNVQGYQGIVKKYTFDANGNVVVGPEGIYVYEWKGTDFQIIGSVQELVAG